MKEEIASQLLVNSGNLHSSMDRFEGQMMTKDIMNCLNLHSSMDRFEVIIITNNVNYIFIYIPVWIDLKLEYMSGEKQVIMNLHSSMDRFEVKNNTI